MNDWERFTGEVSWFLSPGAIVHLGDTRHWRFGQVDALPTLSSLLGDARVTDVLVDGAGYRLLVWGSGDSTRGWIGPLSPEEAPPVHPLHQAFWAVTGGISERFGEPISWWNNQNEVLTVAAAHIDLGAVLRDYRWIWDELGLELSISPSDYYVVAVEANGNLTLVARATGELLLFAPDHDFDGVTPMPGCPPYSLMTIDGLPDLAAWIEACSRAWLDS